MGVNLLDERFDVANILAESYQHDVQHLCVISSDLTESVNAKKLIDTYSKTTDSQTSNADRPNLYYTAGVHPHYAQSVTEKDWLTLNDIAGERSLFAIGECGLDFNRNFSSPESQLYVFEKQLEIAATHKLGVYLHERDAFEEQIKLIEQYNKDLPFAIAHCFTGTESQLQTYLDLGCYIGITGWLCDEKRGQSLRQAVKSLPLSRMLLETDAPYLFPKTIKPRQRANQPKFINAIAQELQALWGLSLEEIQQASTNNALKLVSLGA